VTRCVSHLSPQLYQNTSKSPVERKILFYAYLCKIYTFYSETEKGKGKVIPVLQLSTTPWRRIGRVEVQIHAFLTLALDGGEGSASRPDPQWKRPWYPLDRRLGGPQSRSGCDGERKNSQHLPGLEPPIIQPVVQRYTTELTWLRMSNVWRRTVEENIWAWRTWTNKDKGRNCLTRSFASSFSSLVKGKIPVW
jgi:hypothetical protein